MRRTARAEGGPALTEDRQWRVREKRGRGISRLIETSDECGARIESSGISERLWRSGTRMRMSRRRRKSIGNVQGLRGPLRGGGLTIVVNDR